MAQHKQQPPRAGVQDVTPLLIADLEARAAEGLKTYGRPLQTFNGRNAAQDALEEALDLAQYLKQVVLEQEAGGLRWVKIVSPVVCYDCGRLVVALDAEPRNVLLDDTDGAMAFFCSSQCANVPLTEPPSIHPPTDLKPMDCFVRAGDALAVPCQGRRSAAGLNGYPSSIMVVCDRCGQSYDPTFPPNCPGPCDYGR